MRRHPTTAQHIRAAAERDLAVNRQTEMALRREKGHGSRMAKCGVGGIRRGAGAKLLREGMGAEGKRSSDRTGRSKAGSNGVSPRPPRKPTQSPRTSRNHPTRRPTGSATRSPRVAKARWQPSSQQSPRMDPLKDRRNRSSVSAQAAGSMGRSAPVRSNGRGRDTLGRDGARKAGGKQHNRRATKRQGNGSEKRPGAGSSRRNVSSAGYFDNSRQNSAGLANEAALLPIEWRCRTPPIRHDEVRGRCVVFALYEIPRVVFPFVQ